MFPYHFLISLLPEGGQSFAAGLHPEMLRAWLTAHAGMPPAEAAAAIKEQLQRLAAAPGLRLRMRMLDILAEETRRIAGSVEADLDRAHHPLSTALRGQVVAGNNLLKCHAQSYRAVAEKLLVGWLRWGNGDLLRHALRNAMDLERRRLLLAHRAYAPGSKSAWRSLHRLYRMARSARLDGNAAEDAIAIRHQYLKTLLLALAEPAQLAPGELDRIRFYLERHAGLAELRDLASQAPWSNAASAEGCFLIRRNEEGPGRSLRKWHQIEAQGGDLLLDCGPLLKRMHGQIDAIERGVLPSKVGLPSVAHRPNYLAMMKGLLTLWSAPPVRRFPRQHFKPRVELATGLDDLWTLLSGAPPRRRRGAAAPHPPEAGTVELSEWSVANESPTGFALDYLSGDSGTLAVGMLAGVRSPDRGQTHICLVRRLVSGDARRTELGLQKYAPCAVPTTITWGGGAAAPRPPVRAIVLPQVPSLGGAAAVIAAPGALRPGKRVPFELEGRRLTYVAGMPIEHGVHHEVISLTCPD